MSWNQHHSRSELLAAEAEMATRAGNADRARELYRQAAAEESAAFGHLSSEKTRSRGITAVSAVSLFFKGQDYRAAERLARDYLGQHLPAFAESQLSDLLGRITERGGESKPSVQLESQLGQSAGPLHVPYVIDNPTGNIAAADASLSDTHATDAPTTKTTSTPASMASLRSIVDRIGDAIEQINQDEVINVEFKAKITKSLEDVKAGVQRVARVFKEVDAVKKEILEPVKIAIDQYSNASTIAISKADHAIRQADRKSTVLGIIAVVLGVVAVVPVVFLPRGTPPNPPKPGTLTSAADIQMRINQMHPPRQTVDGNAFPTVREVEALVATNSAEARNVNQCEGAVTRAVPPGAIDLQTRAAAWYSLMVCEGFSHDWEKVASFAQDWGARDPTAAQLKDLSNASYGLAIRVYDAEALVRSGSRGDALRRYKNLDTGAANPSAPRFLSPVDFQLTDGKSFLKRRIADLEALSDLGDDLHIEIYDHAGGTRAEELAGRFKDQGLIHTVSKDENWQSSYRQPQICFKRPLSLPAQNKLRELVGSQHYAMPAALLDPRTYRNPHTHRPDAGLQRWLSDTHSDVDLVILLPLR